MVLLGAVIAGIDVYAQVDPDKQLYDDDIVFQELSSGAQMRLIAKFGPKPATPEVGSASAFNLLTPLAPTEPPPTNVLVNNLAEDLTALDTQSETSLVGGAGSNIVVGFNDSGSFISTTQFTGYSVSTNGGASFTDMGRLPLSPNGDVGDPVLARDTTSGTIYFSTLMFFGSGMQCFRSFNNGVTFTAPVNCAPGTSSVQDKEWIRWITLPARAKAMCMWFGETSDLRLRPGSGSRVPRMVAPATVPWAGL
jgi:hypothetical protein